MCSTQAHRRGRKPLGWGVGCVVSFTMTHHCQKNQTPGQAQGSGGRHSVFALCTASVCALLLHSCMCCQPHELSLELSLEELSLEPTPPAFSTPAMAAMMSEIAPASTRSSSCKHTANQVTNQVRAMQVTNQVRPWPMCSAATVTHRDAHA